MEKKTTILTKSDFIQYLKYLKLILKEEIIDKKILDNIDECIELESRYTPTAYYYDDLLEDFNELIQTKATKNIIRWSKISTWKAYLRKNKIEKLMKKDDL